MKLASKGFLLLAPLALLGREILDIIGGVFGYTRGNTFYSLTFQNGLLDFIMEILLFAFIFCLLLGAGFNLFVKD